MRKSKQNSQLPTEEQVRTLKSLGIDPPDTRQACSSLIIWLDENNKNPKEIVDLIRTAQEKLNKKRVRNLNGTCTGTVKYLARRPRHGATIIHSNPELYKVDPLDAYIIWDSSTPGFSNVGSIRVIK